MKKAPLLCFILLLFPFFAMAANEGQGGYLIPTTAAIPEGFQLVIQGPSADGYALQYRTADKVGVNTIATLFISERTGDEHYNYDQSVRNHFRIPINGATTVVEKIKDINYMGIQGVILHRVSYGRSSYELYLDDNGKLLRILTGDGIDYQFTPEKIEEILRGFVRQPSSIFNAPTGRKVSSVSVLPEEIPVDLRAQTELLNEISKAPLEDNSKISMWIIRHQSELMPLFLMDLSQKLLTENMNDAFEWYTIGVMRGRNDAGRCVYPSPASEMLGLTAMTTLQYARQNVDAFTAAGRKAVERPDLFNYNTPPQWICMDGFTRPATGIALKPQNEWPAIAEAVRSASRIKYQQTKPPE
jgi:hypothetical protein